MLNRSAVKLTKGNLRCFFDWIMKNSCANCGNRYALNPVFFRKSKDGLVATGED